MLGFAGTLSSPMIKTEIRERIATIELARLDKKNALTAAMYAAMTEMLAGAESDAGVRAILIHGRRDCFTAGNDLKDFLEGPSGASQALRFVSALSKVGKPVVAAVGGPAVGIGTTLLLHCDLVYAAPGARFQLPFVPQETLLERARAAAAALAALPPESVRLTKQLMKRPVAAQVAEQMAEEARLFAERLQSAEAKEAMAAFIEKRKPDFSRF